VEEILNVPHQLPQLLRLSCGVPLKTQNAWFDASPHHSAPPLAVLCGPEVEGQIGEAQKNSVWKP
jgi:hypothetical protein